MASLGSSKEEISQLLQGLAGAFGKWQADQAGAAKSQEQALAAQHQQQLREQQHDQQEVLGMPGTVGTVGFSAESVLGNPAATVATSRVPSFTVDEAMEVVGDDEQFKEFPDVAKRAFAAKLLDEAAKWQRISPY